MNNNQIITIDSIENNKINLFISSKNTVDGDKNKLTTTIPDGLLNVDSNSYLIMKIVSFYCYNTFYNVNSNNNKVNINDVIYYLPIGNPNVLDIRDNLNTQLSSINLNITYDKITNKFIFYNISLSTITIIPLGSGQFLGLNDNTTYTISSNNSLSSINPISVVSVNSINVSLTGDVVLYNNNIDNIRNGNIQLNNIIFQKLVDSKKNEILKYENNGDDTFKYRLSNNDSINYLTLNMLDQDLNYISNMSDYYITIQFERFKNGSDLDVLMKIKEYIYDILQLLFSIAQHYRIL